MSRQIQIRRGTTAENDAFTGAIGEITMDTTRKTLRVHDGETVGGTTLAKQSDIPSAESITNAVMPDYEKATDFPALGTYTATTNLYLQGYVQLVWNAVAYNYITIAQPCQTSTQCPLGRFGGTRNTSILYISVNAQSQGCGLGINT